MTGLDVMPIPDCCKKAQGSTMNNNLQAFSTSHLLTVSTLSIWVADAVPHIGNQVPSVILFQTYPMEAFDCVDGTGLTLRAL